MIKEELQGDSNEVKTKNEEINTQLNNEIQNQEYNDSQQSELQAQLTIQMSSQNYSDINSQENSIQNENQNGNEIENGNGNGVHNEQDCNEKSQNSSQIETNRSLEPEQFRKVFIGGLSFKTEDETFKAYFSKYGELVDYVVMKDRETGKSRGFGFVTYANSTQVDELMKNRPHTIDGRQVETKRATPREDAGKYEVQQTTTKLFVGGVRDNITEDDLKSYFGNYGNVTDVVVMKDKETNKPRGFGFVNFDDYDPVDKIILEKHHEINGINLQCQKATPKDSQNKSNQPMNKRNNFNNNQQTNFNPQFNSNFQRPNLAGSGLPMSGGQFSEFNNGSMNNTYGFYNQAPVQANRDRGGGNVGPVRGGHGKFTARSQGPYGGTGGFNRGGSQGGFQRGGHRRGYRGGHRGTAGPTGTNSQQQFFNN